MMSAIQKLKWLILSTLYTRAGFPALPFEYDKVDDLFDFATSTTSDWTVVDDLDDDEKASVYSVSPEEFISACHAHFESVLEDIRDSGEETNMPTPASNYDGISKAAQLPDDSWVGWTYWYGGGRFDMPEFEPWVEHAYDLTKQTETKTIEVVVNTFKSGNMESTVTLL